MKKINHNLIKPLQSIAVTIGIVGIMLLSGAVDNQQEIESQEVNAEIYKSESVRKDEQSIIDSAIHYIDLNADLGDSWDIKYYINEASNIYNLDSLQIVAVRNEFYLD